MPHFIYWLLTRVGLIEIATDNDGYAYAIFETMNDRGKPLSPVDMLKAYLLAPIEDADARNQANRVWKQEVLSLISWGGDHEPERDANCIKAWLRAQHAQTIRERKAGSVDKDWELIGSTFHRWVRDHNQELGLGKAQPNQHLMAESFPFFAKAYRRILEVSRTYTPGWEPLYYNAHNDFTWQSTVLLAPLLETDDDETVRRKMVATATYLDIWLMRRAVNYIRVGYEYKREPYSKQNFYAASLDDRAYQHQPQFQQFIAANQLPFKPAAHFTKAEQLERRDLLKAMVDLVWSPSRRDVL